MQQEREQIEKIINIISLSKRFADFLSSQEIERLADILWDSIKDVPLQDYSSWATNAKQNILHELELSQELFGQVDMVQKFPVADFLDHYYDGVVKNQS